MEKLRSLGSQIDGTVIKRPPHRHCCLARPRGVLEGSPLFPSAQGGLRQGRLLRACSVMIPKGKSVILAGFVSFHWTNFCTGRRRAPAFFVQVPGKGAIPAHGRHRARREQRTPLFSAAEKADATQQLSDLDARVIDELLSDPAFLESLLEEGVELEQRDEDSVAGMVGNSTMASNSRGALAPAEGVTSPPNSSEYESVTMQVVEELQDSVKGILAKVSAAFESAGIYVANRARMDTKVIQAVVEYTSKQAAAGTGRLLLAASGAASPALLMMGVNTTETQAALNDSVQLLSMGIVPDSIGVSPKLLTSLKDFDDDDKRLDEAYRRQRRRRSKPLPARLLGSLPSTINKAADLAYEVEQEVKYERAGSRANKLLKPIGISLPEAQGNPLLFESTSSGSGGKRLEASDAKGVSRARISGSNTVADAPSIGQSTAAEAMEKLLREASARLEPTPPAPDSFRAVRRFRKKGANAQWQRSSSDASVAESKVDSVLAIMLASRRDVLKRELLNSVQAVDDEVRLRQRGVKAANAVLCSTEPVIAGLEESRAREVALLEELKNVARNVQQIYVLAEMTEAVQAAEAYLERLEGLSAHVVELASELRTYVATAGTRMEQLATLRSWLVAARELNIQDDVEASKLEFSTTTLELLQAFEDEVVSRQQEAKTVGRLLRIVWGESEERARDEAGRAHEHALVAACRLWEASAVEGIDQRARRIDNLRLESTRVKEEASSTPWEGAEAGSSAGAAPEAERKVLSQAAEKERSSKGAATERLRVVQGEAERDAETSTPQERVAPPPVNEGLGVASIPAVDGDTRVEGSELDVSATGRMASSNPTPVTAAAKMSSNVNNEMSTDLDQPSGSDEAIDATLVSDATVVSSTRSLNGHAEPRRTASDASSIEIVVDETACVDVEVEVEDDVLDPTRVGLKFLDVFALLIEKIIFVGFPTLVSGGSLVWERVDNAINGAKGRKGWRLLKRLKKDSFGLDDT